MHDVDRVVRQKVSRGLIGFLETQRTDDALRTGHARGGDSGENRASRPRCPTMHFSHEAAPDKTDAECP